MGIDVIIKSDDYKQGFCDAMFQVVRIINDNAELQQKALINLLNTVVAEINKDIK